MRRVHHGICNFCDAACGIEIEVSGREILSIRGDDLDPFSRGHICPKATAQKDLFDDPDRLRRPIRRRGRDWEEIPWPEAIAHVARRAVEIQRRHGDDALALYYGNPMGHSYQALMALIPLLKIARTRNVFSSSSVDSHPRMLVSATLYGNQAILPVPDIERTDLFVIQGANPMVSNGSVMTAPDIKRRLQDLRARGGRIVVLDPRRTETAEIADEHHFIRPGTDALLLLAVLHALEAEGAFSRAPRDLARGVDDLAAIVRRFSPDRVALAVGIEAAAIRALASSFARARSAVWYGRMGISTQDFGCISTWLVDAVNIVTGNVDRPGGAMFSTPAVDLGAIAALIGETGKFGRFQSRVAGLPELNGEIPVAAMADEMETPGRGQIRALLTIAGNPILSIPNGRRLDRAFAGLEFMASVDFYLNETTRHAEVILPPVTALESDHYPLLELAMGIRDTAHYAEAAIPREPGARADAEILVDLSASIARRRGGLDALAAPAVEALGAALRSGLLLDLLLRVGPHRLRLADLRRQVHGVDLGPLRPRLRAVIRTPDRRIDLAPARLMADLARVEARLSAAAPEGAFLLVSRRTLRSMNSWLHNAGRLVSGRPRCTLLMHPDDAAALGLTAGRRVKVRSRVGEIEAALDLSAGVMRGVVSLPYGWGHDREGTRMAVARAHADVSFNDLTDEARFDHVSGTSVLDGIPVWIEPRERAS